MKLNRGEMFTAATAGVMRRLNAIKHGRQDAYGQSPLDRWGMDIESSAAELLVAKKLGLYWNYFSEDPSSLEGDVGKVQVRHTARADGCLLLHDRDKSDVPFVLVVGHYPALRIVGWCLGSYGKDKRYWREDTGRPAYFVPQSDLRPMEEFEA
jgi:hypothetical protein